MGKKYSVKVIPNSEFKGLKGPLGETWLVLIRDNRNPIGSAWIWCVTAQEASEKAFNILKVIGMEV